VKDIVVIGSGGFSKQVIEIIEQINFRKREYNFIGIIDDNRELIGSNVLGYKVIGDTDYLEKLSREKKVHGVIAIADGKIRKIIAEKLKKVIWVNLIHPSAVVSKYVDLGVGNIICGGVVINPDFKLGNHCHINIGSSLGHDVNMFDFVTVMPGARISGNVLLKNHATVGTGSTIIQGITIDVGVVLGAGSVTVKNTKPQKLYVGVPARKIKNLPSS
jgi:sugar O-acyltransferase (sialic acid O-acetyltransferase NeuD family)